jgi:ubiquinone/menaquinone biosynthesis C-methylase UbiE
MRQSLGWAIGYNAIALPIAAGVFEPAFGLVLRPEIAALSMSGSSPLVTSSGLTRRRAGRQRARRRAESLCEDERWVAEQERAMTSAATGTDYDQMAGRYDDGRAFPLGQLDGWRRAVVGLLGTGSGDPVLDVGSGTGVWSLAFARWFGVRVVGVEPSTGMRGQAALKRSHPRIAYVGGRAEAIPVAGETCRAAWLSTAIHHFGDLPAAARELRRVLRPGAPVLVREGFTGRTHGIPWLSYFPEARAITERFWPTVDAVVSAFAPAGFGFESLQPVGQITARNLRDYADLVRVRADSTLIQLSEDQFVEGMNRLDKAAAAISGDEPVTTILDLLVLR